MQNILQKLIKKPAKQEDSDLFKLKANRIFLDGPAGSGKTNFINRTIGKMLEDKDIKTNFILANAHGDLLELADKLLELNYKLFVFNSYTERKFVEINRADSRLNSPDPILNILTHEADDKKIWDCLTTEPKTAIIINDFDIEDIDLYTSLVNGCIKQLAAKGPHDDVNLITLFDDFEYLFSSRIPEQMAEDEASKLVSELFKKYRNPYVERLKMVFSGQMLSKIPVFSEALKTDLIYQYINFGTGFSSSGSKSYTAAERVSLRH